MADKHQSGAQDVQDELNRIAERNRIGAHRSSEPPDHPGDECPCQDCKASR